MSAWFPMSAAACHPSSRQVPRPAMVGGRPSRSDLARWFHLHFPGSLAYAWGQARAGAAGASSNWRLSRVPDL